MPPPQPPEIRRRVKFYRSQMIGLPLIWLLPILALFKLFDTTFQTVSAESNGLVLSVRYPDKLRYRTFEPLEIGLENRTGSMQKKVQVHLSEDYVRAFRDPAFRPDVTDIDEGSYVVELTDVRSGERRTVTVDLEADFAGSHDAEVEVAAGSALVSARFSTFVYP
jgi:hypothetical protein